MPKKIWCYPEMAQLGGASPAIGNHAWSVMMQLFIEFYNWARYALVLNCRKIRVFHQSRMSFRVSENSQEICSSQIPRRARAFSKMAAFSLLEVLLAVTVLTLMMTFMLGILGSSLSLFQVGNKKIEAAQAARMGLNIMANDLKNAFAGNMTTYTTNGTSNFNVAPFLAIDTPAYAVGSTFSSLYNAQNSAGSQQISFIKFIIESTGAPYQETQYQSIYLGSRYGEMRGNRYYLVRGHQIHTSIYNGNFYFRGSVNETWVGGGTGYGCVNITDNCLRLTFQYYGNESSATGTTGWISNGTWSPRDRLPRGVLVTMTVIDSKTAEKIAAIKGDFPLTESEIDNGLASPLAANASPVERLISQGMVTMSRFVPFNSN